MKRILSGLFFALLLSSTAYPGETDAARTDVLVRSGLSWDGRQLPQYPKGTPEITILRITIPPGVQLPMHSHPVINAGMLLSGELTVVTEDNKILHLKAGDPIVEVLDKRHYGRNEGTAPAVILVFYAGIKEAPITIK